MNRRLYNIRKKKTDMLIEEVNFSKIYTQKMRKLLQKKILRDILKKYFYDD